MKFNFKPQGIIWAVVFGLGLPLGLICWTLLVKWAYNAFFPLFGAPVIGFQAAAALALMLLFIVGVYFGGREAGK